MDPNATLARIRWLIENGSTYDDWHELAQLVKALDEWLSKGGMPPRDWKPF